MSLSPSPIVNSVTRLFHDEAVALARSRPLGGYVEIRPLMSPTGRIYGYRPDAQEAEDAG